jgi:hypothetical protein
MSPVKTWTFVGANAVLVIETAVVVLLVAAAAGTSTQASAAKNRILFIVYLLQLPLL